MTATRTVSYPICETSGILDPQNDSLCALVRHAECGLVVVDSNIDRLYGPRLRDYFHGRGLNPGFIVLPCDEKHKSPPLLEQVIQSLDASRALRRTPVLAVGGGILLDVVGMASGQYRRGTPYVRVPTTLLAMVDAAMGAKTGVNFDGHKNRIGSYHPPSAVLIDREFLATLPTRHIRNGVAEILKMGLMLDSGLVELLDRHGQDLIAQRFLSAAGADVIRRAASLMLDELEPNLWEDRLDRLVDFGHSFSPAIEMASVSDLLHGEAVAIDMVLSCTIAAGRGMITGKEWGAILSLVSRLGLPVSHPCCEPEFLWKGLQDTVLHRDGLQRLPLPAGIGHGVFCNDVTRPEVSDACRRIEDWRGPNERA